MFFLDEETRKSVIDQEEDEKELDYLLFISLYYDN